VRRRGDAGSNVSYDEEDDVEETHQVSPCLRRVLCSVLPIDQDDEVDLCSDGLAEPDFTCE